MRFGIKEVSEVRQFTHLKIIRSRHPIYPQCNVCQTVQHKIMAFMHMQLDAIKSTINILKLVQDSNHKFATKSSPITELTATLDADVQVPGKVRWSSVWADVDRAQQWTTFSRAGRRVFSREARVLVDVGRSTRLRGSRGRSAAGILSTTLFTRSTILTKPVSNVRPSVRPQKVSPISMKFGV